MNCCVQKLGSFAHNQEIKTGIQTGQAGNHILYMKSSSGGTFTLSYEQTLSQEIIIPVGVLNESMAYKFRIELPDGSFYTQNDCDTFSLLTIINSQIDGCSDNCNADSDSGNYYGY